MFFFSESHLKLPESSKRHKRERDKLLADTTLTRIGLIATDGVSQRKIFWIDARENGVYVGYCEQGKDFHISYHGDGAMYRTANGKTNKMYQAQALAKFKNAQSIITFGVPTDLNLFVGVDYNLKELDALISLDVRSMQKICSSASCHILLLEPRRLDLIANMDMTSIRQIQVFTDYQPWIAVLIRAPG